MCVRRIDTLCTRVTGLSNLIRTLFRHKGFLCCTILLGATEQKGCSSLKRLDDPPPSQEPHLNGFDEFQFKRWIIMDPLILEQRFRQYTLT